MTFKDFGLNKFRNTMQSPRCDCGCGNKAYLQLDTADDVLCLADEFLRELDCNRSAVFVAADDGYYALIKDWSDDDDDPWESGKLNGAPKELIALRLSKLEKTFFADDSTYPAIEFFSYIDHDYQLHGYGLMVETEKGFEVVED